MGSSFPLHATQLLFFICCTAFMLPNPCLSFNQSSSLILPLKVTQIQSPSIPRPPNKLAFRHNVSLTVSIAVGSPPQRVTMVLDTGSQLSWLRCNKSSTLSFNPHLSTSYQPILCSSPTCTPPTPDFTVPVSCDPNSSLCRATLSYADASSVEGNLASENFRLDGGSGSLPRMVFGCMDSGSSSNPDEDSKTAGLIGMNRGPLSFVSQTGFTKFSYCISGHDSSGVLLFGDANFPWLRPLNYTPLVQISAPLPYFDRVAYTVQLKGIRVSDTVLPLPESVYKLDHTGAGQTMVDSGTQFTFLLGPAYVALKNEFLRQTKGILTQLDDPNFKFQGAMDVCYRVGDIGKVDLQALPSVSLIFQGVEIRVYGEKLLYRVQEAPGVGDGVYCLTFGNSDLLGVEAYVIGHHHQQNVWVEFDLANSRVGLTEFSCDLANQRMGLVSD